MKTKIKIKTKINTTMKKVLPALLTTMITASPVMADELRIGVAMATFDDNFMTLLRTGISKYG